MNIKSVFEVFSRRPGRAPAAPLKPLTTEFRTRVLMLCRDRFSAPAPYAAAGNWVEEFWMEMHGRLTYLLGRPRLSGADGPPMHDAIKFLMDCSDDHFLDFVEYIFQVECYWRACPEESIMVDEINRFLLIEDLPYAVTPFVHETATGQFMGHMVEGVRRVISFPKIVFREHQVPYAEAVEPAIQLLADKGFSSANQEFLAALEDYRKGRYGDCLTKCGSAFESTMKLICDRREWAYKPTDAAGALLHAVMTNSGMESFFEQPLLLIATMRSRLGSAHGGGPQPRAVPPHRARYVINATAAAILFLVEECA